MDRPSILTHLHELYHTREKAKHYMVSNVPYNHKLVERGRVNPYVVNMISYIKWMVSLGFFIDSELAIYLLLKFLSPYQANFIINFNLSKKEKSFEKLLYMLKTIEQDVRKVVSTILVIKVTTLKAKAKGKAKTKSKA